MSAIQPKKKRQERRPKIGIKKEMHRRNKENGGEIGT
jgi:hypothetical protein